MPHPPTPRPWLHPAWAALLLLTGGLAAYHNSFSLPFLFDDKPAIIDNLTLRSLRTAFTPFGPTGSGVYGRPLVNFSLALNYAFSGTDVRSYHVVNLLIHLANGFLLFEIIRRTLVRPCFEHRFASSADALGGVAAVLWMTHPLLTESVSSVIQRTESLVSFFYLLTFYAYIRSLNTKWPTGWRVLSVAACLLGMWSKEVMVSAPLAVFLYDRTFAAGRFGEAWRERTGFYISLFSTVAVLIVLIALTHGNRGGTCGIGTTASPWTYMLTQCEALPLYLKLSFWPAPLVFDYGTHLVTDPTDVLFRGIFIILLLVATILALCRWPKVGFVAALFFLILAPSSSVIPLTTQTMAEHRMYLPLATVVVLFVLIAQRLIGKAILPVGLALACVLATATIARNRDYRTGEALWQDTVKKWPSCARAHNNLGSIHFAAGRHQKALAEYENAIRLDPFLSNAHYNQGIALLRMDRRAEARASFDQELKINPDHGQARFELGRIWVEMGEPEQGMRELEPLVLAEPANAPAHYYLGDALAALGLLQAAQLHFEAAIRLRPEYAESHCSLADLLANAGKAPEAVSHYEEALRLRPDYADAHNNYANLLVQLGHIDAALGHYEEAVRVSPALIEARCNYGAVLWEINRYAEARVQFAAALQQDPRCERARTALASLPAEGKPSARTN